MKSNKRPTVMKGIAHAKINLSLHITGKLPNGYHKLDSLVVFTEFGDILELRRANKFILTTCGTFNRELPPSSENIILAALQILEGASTEFKINLEKSIPVSAGLGGGSTNAAQALKLAAALLECPLPNDSDKITSVGSDLPVCLTGKPALVRGFGEKITILDRFFEFPILLVNPNKPVPTGDVYKQLSAVNNPPQTSYPVEGNKCDVIDWLKEQRNDLEAPAFDLCPETKDVLFSLRKQEGCLLARMSGSGGTCFGIFQTMEQTSVAARKIKIGIPEWWVQPTRILPQ